MTDLPENVDLKFLATLMLRMDVRLDGMDTRLDGMDKRLEALDGRMDRFEGRMDHFEIRMGGFEGRMSSLEIAVTRLAEVGSKTIDAVVQLAKSVDQIKETSAIIEGRLVRIEKRFDLVRA